MKLVLAPLFAIVLTACMGTAGNVRAPYQAGQSDRFTYELDNYGGMSPEGRAILESRLRSQLSSRLVPGDAQANRIKIRVTYYRMRHGAARALVGIMAGQDRIVSEVSISSPAGQPLGSLMVDSKNPTAMFTAKGLIEDHADEIVKFVRGEPAQPSSSAPTSPPTSQNEGSVSAPRGDMKWRRKDF